MATSLAISSSRGPRPLELGKLRQNRGLTLEEIAENTKISMRFLRAIESEEFSQLPGGIFNTSYLRQYAAAIGYEEAKLLAHYRMKAGDDEEAEFPQPGSSRGGLLRWLSVRI